MARLRLLALVAALALGSGLDPVSAAAAPVAPPQPKAAAGEDNPANNPGLAPAVKVLGSMATSIQALHESVNAKAVGSGKLTTNDVEAFAKQRDAIVAKTVAELKAVPGLTPEVRADVLAQFGKSAADLAARTSASWTRLTAGDVAGATWFKDPAANSKMYGLLAGWQKNNLAEVESMTATYTSNKLTPEAKAAAAARFQANTQELKDGVKGIKGVTGAELKVALTAIDSMAIAYKGRLQDTVASLIASTPRSATSKPVPPAGTAKETAAPSEAKAPVPKRRRLLAP